MSELLLFFISGRMKATQVSGYMKATQVWVFSRANLCCFFYVNLTFNFTNFYLTYAQPIPNLIFRLRI